MSSSSTSALPEAASNAELSDRVASLRLKLALLMDQEQQALQEAANARQEAVKNRHEADNVKKQLESLSTQSAAQIQLIREQSAASLDSLRIRAEAAEREARAYQDLSSRAEIDLHSNSEMMDQINHLNLQLKERDALIEQLQDRLERRERLDGIRSERHQIQQEVLQAVRSSRKQRSLQVEIDDLRRQRENSDVLRLEIASRDSKIERLQSHIDGMAAMQSELEHARHQNHLWKEALSSAFPDAHGPTGLAEAVAWLQRTNDEMKARIKNFVDHIKAVASENKNQEIQASKLRIEHTEAKTAAVATKRRLEAAQATLARLEIENKSLKEILNAYQADSEDVNELLLARIKTADSARQSAELEIRRLSQIADQ